MTSMHNSLYFGAARKTGSTFVGLWRAIVSLFAAYRNRRQVMRLEDFSDAQLADIGLTRSDVRYALRGGVFDDRSKDLARVATLRRTLAGQL